MKIADLILFQIGKLNAFYPNLPSINYSRYKSFYQKNYHDFDNTKKLLQTVNFAISTIPYYREKVENPIQNLNDFTSNLEPIDKNVVMASHDSFVLPKFSKRKVVEGTTGGTSGKPLKLILPKDRYIVELNTMSQLWNNLGWTGQYRAVIRNTHLDSTINYKISPIKKEVIFDGFKTDDKYYETIYNTITKLNIKFIHAYPSSAYQFSLYLKKCKKDVSNIVGFLSGSEGLMQFQRDLIVEELGLKIYNWYGHSEKLILGGPCRYNSDIHIEPTYGYFELLDENNLPITEVGKSGEMVGTTLNNKYMPLIRYKTGDYAEYAGNYCPYCKRHLILIKNIQGRWDKNRIYLNDKTYVTTTALNLHSALYNKIDGMQYVQEQIGSLKILVLKNEKFDNNSEVEFIKHFDKSLQGKCNFEISYVQNLLKEENGKFLFLKQNIK